MPRSARLGFAAHALLWAVSGCDSQRHFFTDVVDCTNLPAAPDALVDDPSASDGMVADLGPDSSRAVLRWGEPGGGDWFRSPVTTGYVIHDSNYLASWIVTTELSCEPQATVNVRFDSPDTSASALTPGDYPITEFGFAVPTLEQGNSGLEEIVEGTVTITEVAGGRVSGTMNGRVRTELRSYATEELLNLEVEVTALAFQTLALE